MKTEAGKRLLAQIIVEDDAEWVFPLDPEAAIAAIEAEACAAERARIAEAVRGLEGQCHDGEGLGCDSFPCEVNVSRAAVLAIVEGKTP